MSRTRRDIRLVDHGTVETTSTVTEPFTAIQAGARMSRVATVVSTGSCIRSVEMVQRRPIGDVERE